MSQSAQGVPISEIIPSRLTNGRPMLNILDKWKDFRGLPYADEILIGVGAMLLIVSILKIVKSSLKMFFWVALAGLGLTGIAQGLDHNPFVAAAVGSSPVADYIGTSKEISSDALSILCRKMEETELLQLEQN